MSTSAIRKFRYADNSRPVPIDVNAYAAFIVGDIMDLFREARVPMNVALRSAEMAEDELRDRMAEESLSWSEKLTPTHAGDRARLEEEYET